MWMYTCCSCELQSSSSERPWQWHKCQVLLHKSTLVWSYVLMCRCLRSSCMTCLVPPWWKCSAGNVVPHFSMKIKYDQPSDGRDRRNVFRSLMSKLTTYLAACEDVDWLRVLAADSSIPATTTGCPKRFNVKTARKAQASGWIEINWTMEIIYWLQISVTLLYHTMAPALLSQCWYF